MRRLMLYLLCLLAFFALLEGCARSSSSFFYALGDKFYLKVELLRQRQNNDFVFIGSSRTLDGVDSNVLYNSLESKTFNGGLSNYNYQKFLYFVREGLKINNTDYYVLEWSTASLQDGDFEAPGNGKSIHLKKPIEKGVDLEERLQNKLVEKVKLVEFRRSLSLKAILRLLMVWTSDSHVHDIWFRNGVLRQFIQSKVKVYDRERLNSYSGLLKIEKDLSASNLEEIKQWENYQKIKRVIDLILDAKSKVALYRPPVDKGFRSVECNKKNDFIYRAILQEYSNVTVLDYACHDFNESLFRNSKHLSPWGRHFFSQVIALDLANLLDESEGN